MQAEIIAFGTELTTGAKLDTNSQWLSVQLSALGIPVHYHTTVGDDLPGMVAVLRAAVERSALVLVTGGLGPTLDDLTRHALAELTGTELERHEPSLEHIRELFARRGRTMPERNIVQAMFPRGSESLPNPRGTAPGIWMEVPSHTRMTPAQVACLPGVPSELHMMFEHEVLPRLPAGGQVIRQARLNCFGLGESAVEEKLEDLTARGRDPEVGITAHQATITLRITAHGETAAACEEKIAATKSVIRERLGTLVFGEEDEDLEHALVCLLNERRLTLATAESGTGGLLAHRLTDVAGSDACYLGGIVAPTETAKCDLLDVPAHVLDTSGPVGETVATSMARGCRDRFGTDFALSIAATSLNDSSAVDTNTPVAFIALAGRDLEDVRELSLAGDPAIAKSRTVKAAMNLLRRQLLE